MKCFVMSHIGGTTLEGSRKHRKCLIYAESKINIAVDIEVIKMI